MSDVCCLTLSVSLTLSDMKREVCLNSDCFIGVGGNSLHEKTVHVKVVFYPGRTLVAFKPL